MEDNKDKPREWPIAPTFLSLRQKCTEDKANYNTDGIFYTDYIRGFLADLSHDNRIQNALSLFQFVPEDFIPLDSNAKYKDKIPTDPEEGTVLLNEPLQMSIEAILNHQKKKIIRIDSGTFVNNGKLCDAFRRWGRENSSFCFRRDSIVGIFAGDDLNDFNPYSNEDRKKLEKFIKDNGYKNIKVDDIGVKVKEGDNEVEKRRIYIHYTCPISLFEEHIFPIYTHGHVIACLMLGQMARENFDREKAFSGYKSTMKHKNGNIIDFKAIDITSCKKGEWDEKAQAIAERIQIFETRLEERIVHRNTRYVNEAFEEIELNFKEKVRNINIKEEDVFSQFTKVLNQAFSDIREKFDNSNDGFIRMFALPISIEHDELVPIGWDSPDFKAKEKAKIDIKQLKGIEHTLKIDKEEERTEEQIRIILDASNKEINSIFNKKKDIFLPGLQAGKEVAYIVWKRHNNELRKKNEKNFDIYRKTLKNFYSIAQEGYSYIRGARMELLLETTIQESTHESAHFILPAIDVVEQQLYPLPVEMILPAYSVEYAKYIDSYEKYKDEVLESLNQLGEINSGASLIFTSDLKLKKAEVKVFYLLYKLKKMLDKRAKDGHQFILYSQSNDYVDANIDVTYFNHALYNLLDNAIKYGYDGSNIYINMDVNKHKNALSVRIVSYGIGIPKDENSRVYKLFERGLEASKITRGTGLGMYIVQKVCEAHGGTVSHTSEPLSEYNIPVLFNYKYKSSLAKNFSEDDKSAFDNELKRLSGVEKDIVNDARFVEYTNVFSNRIKMATYKNTFIVTIPLH